MTVQLHLINISSDNRYKHASYHKIITTYGLDAWNMLDSQGRRAVLNQALSAYNGRLLAPFVPSSLSTRITLTAEFDHEEDLAAWVLAWS